jgi:hypothetical protein
VQRTWEIRDIARIAETLSGVSRSAEFSAGVLALAYALNAPVQMPERREHLSLIIVDANSQEVTR